MNRRRGVTFSLAGLLAVLALVTMVSAGALANPPGSDQHPYGGPYSDLKGGKAGFTFETNAVLTCSEQNDATGFGFTLDYTITGTLPAGATVVVYLSPNNGAEKGAADPTAYTNTVESNYAEINLGGYSGTGHVHFNVPITHGFVVYQGGILGVIAREAPPDGQVWMSKTNSLNCSESSQTLPPTATPTATQTATATATQTATATATQTATATATATQTATATATATQTATATATQTATATHTATATATATQTATATHTATATATQTATETVAEVTATPVVTATPIESVGGVTSQPSTFTPPPTTTSGNGSNEGGFPLFAFALCAAFAGLAMMAIRMEKESLKR